MRIYRVTHPDAYPGDPTDGPAALVVAPDEARAIAETARIYPGIPGSEWRRASVRYIGVGRGPVRVEMTSDPTGTRTS